ncbi:DNA-binding transcriptional ArsR family regulator [Diaminobutyricimonas aerilata]|uniref:DNA-binding transcriptional ArsR family regulator n=1 Tax=Diaminobutyricimonas aerilata TaxID=1162967 RepID=A0A2M9CJC8_9MICO|nr:DUF5937 family protein [Diaminobutyricimonas aerilata]PJJ71948.1 DNA-binding transcriptional ArsR family regulator [Diaminobutyricimonas aerilata]
MLRYRLTGSDLGEVRFGISPLCELGLSLRAIRDPSRFPLQVGWLRATERARSRVDLDALLPLLNDRTWSPDFLNPRPESPLTRVEDELAALERLDPDVFARQIASVHGHVPERIAADPRAARDRVVRALRELWHACFAPYWPRMRAVLDADIAYRGRQVARHGLAAMLNGLAPTVSFADDVVSVTMKDPRDREFATDGAGLTLVPTMFTRRASVPVDDGPPLILYSARGAGTLLPREPDRDPAAVAALLGAARTDLLVALRDPGSPTSLAARFGVTPSAVAQHLRVLREAGLVSATRAGRSVLYLRTDLASALLAGRALD